MTRRPALLAATLFLATFDSAQAQKLTLPVGEWGRQGSQGPHCNPPFLKIEQDRIIKRLGGGEGRCPIKKIKKEGTYLIVDVNCVYDKSIPQEHLIEGDDDDGSFSLIVMNPTLILFNNTPHGLCHSATEGGN